MTTPRENLLKVYRKQKPDWTPVVFLADGYNHPSHMPEGFYERAEGLDLTAVLTQYFGLDLLDRIGGYRECYHNVRYTSTMDGDMEKRRWETPYGVLTGRWQTMRYPTGVPGEPELITYFPAEYPVKSVDDYRAFAYVFEDMTYEFDYPAIERRVKEVGEAGIVTVGGPSSMLGMNVRVFMGVEHLGYAYYDHPRELGRVFEAMGDNYCRCYDGIAHSAADGTINYDDTTTLAISPRMFREVEAPWLDRCSDIMHAQGKVYINHACGHVRGLLEDFRHTHIDGFDGPSAPPVGNTTVAEALAGFGPDIVVMAFTEEYAMRSPDPEVVRGYIRSMFEQARGASNFIVDIVSPPALSVGNLWLAVDEAKRLSGRGR
jgi:hypothetical protein